MQRWLLARRWLVGAGLLLLALQLVPVRRPPATPLAHAGLEAPPPVQALLQRSCFDCHSQATAWPWYAQVAPMSWWTAAEVRRGRAALDFSNWHGYSPRQQAFLLGNSVRRARAGLMPPRLYAWAHPQTRLTDAELATLLRYAESFRPERDLEEGVILAFCREDGQLGEVNERRLLATWRQGTYHLWDPETGRRATASTLDDALAACGRLLSADPAMRLATWERRFLPQWRKALRQLSEPLPQPPLPTRRPAPSAHPPPGASGGECGRGLRRSAPEEPGTAVRAAGLRRVSAWAHHLSPPA